MNRGQQQNGFTLLELLIAMTLLGMLLVVLYGGFNIGIKSWDKGEAHADKLNEIRIAQEFLRTQLRQSVTVFRTDAVTGRELYFIGESDRIGWVAPMLRYLGMGGLYYLELDHVGDGTVDAGELRIRWYPYSPGNEDNVIDGDDSEQTVLLAGVTEFEVEYFGADEPGEDPYWTSQWVNLQQRPELIKVNVSLADNAWPELIIPVLN